MKRVLAIAMLATPIAAHSEPVRVIMETSLGTVHLELDAKNAPKSVENFLGYVDDGHYDGTVFHRVIAGFMIQGGGFDTDLRQRPTRAPVANEAGNGLSNQRGTIAMARTADPHSATAQFFINHADNVRLDKPSFDGWGYAVFGRVVEGMDVVDSIAAVETGAQGPFRSDVPVTQVVITKVRRAPEAGAKP
jgi:cyclophilin family peptidyl-prolyl cis-trans isomerase